MSVPARVLLVSGSTRNGSANTAALATMAAMAPGGVTAMMYDGLVTDPDFATAAAEVWAALLTPVRRSRGNPAPD